MLLVGPNAGDTYTLTLESDFAGKVTLNGVAYSRLASFAGEIRASLEQSKIGIRNDSDKPDATSMFTALETIREKGWSALSALVSDQWYGRQPGQLRDFLSTVLTNAPGTRTPVLRFVSPLDLPIDIMPALQSRSARFVQGSADDVYEQARSSFIGMQFAVQKIRFGTEEEGSELIRSRLFNGGKCVVLAPYWHRGLEDVERLVHGLSTLGFFEVLHPLPDDNFMSLRDDREATDMVIDGRKPPAGPEGVVHFACHCDAGDTLPSLDHCLRLSGRWLMGKELRLTVSSLQARGAGIAQHGPIAVITACGASDVRYDKPVSIPDALLYAGFRSVISPMVSVKVKPGNALALFMYAALKSEGATVGSALVEARKLLLQRRGHALGLLYTCYGDARLHLDAEVIAQPDRDRIAV